MSLARATGAFRHTIPVSKAARAAAPQNALWSSLQGINRVFQRAFAPGRQKRNPKEKYKRAIIKGNFVRLKVVAPPPPAPAKLPKLPQAGPTLMPRPFESVPASPIAASQHHNPTIDVAHKTVEGAASAETLSRARQKDKRYSNYERSKAWIRQNLAVLVLNFGSVCTLFGFTRSDVLELRAMSMTGSLCSICFETINGIRNPAVGIRWAPLVWSSTFSGVNAYNIYKILDERKSRVKLEEHEEAIYVEHFMPHGVTPKQFHKISLRSKTRIIPKGSFIIQEGTPITSVYLVVNGRTKALDNRGRRLTAASSTAGNRERRRGGDSGAWIGEMAFLESFWKKETNQNLQDDEQAALLSSNAIYTIRAQTDCEVLEWSFEEMEDIMHISTDMRAAMTRSMTAAIVGKVVNFTVAGRTGPTWSTWLKDWKYAGGGDVQVSRLVEKGNRGLAATVSGNGDDDDDDNEAGVEAPPL
jgi:CRP-like cAMP-binding protein